jgi:hypothetical protein
VRVTLVDPQGTLLREIADTSMKRKDVAMTYAFALCQESEVDFATVNAAIIERWSRSALKWIKTYAWKRVAERGAGE